LSVEAIRNVCTEGPGHFLGHDQTLSLMQSEYVYPEIGDRMSPKEWIESGRVDILERARAKTRQILSTHYPRHISDALDSDLRRRFPVRLPRELMRPGNARWS
ncbi:MAG TPA: trimethylamine methyltransferase family protein, partial [Kiloniellales bacterium]